MPDAGFVAIFPAFTARPLRVLLKITDKGDYDWVECCSCEAGWQVPHYAESVR